MKILNEKDLSVYLIESWWPCFNETSQLVKVNGKRTREKVKNFSIMGCCQSGNILNIVEFDSKEERDLILRELMEAEKNGMNYFVIK